MKEIYIISFMLLLHMLITSLIKKGRDKKREQHIIDYISYGFFYSITVGLSTYILSTSKYSITSYILFIIAFHTILEKLSENEIVYHASLIAVLVTRIIL